MNINESGNENMFGCCPEMATCGNENMFGWCPEMATFGIGSMIVVSVIALY